MPPPPNAEVALVTGAGSGIGRASAIALAADGWTLVLAGRDEAKLARTTDEISTGGGRAMAVVCDVTDEDDVRRLFAAATTSLGRVDLLFNNAGIGAPAVPFEELTLSMWSSVIATNLTGAFLCTRQAFLVMKHQTPRGGRIINNGSLSAYVPRARSAPYTASKHAITGLTRSTSLDGRSHGIACGQIDIGNAGTEMTTRMSDGVLQADGSLRSEPTIDVRDVARAVTYMASLPLEANVQFMTVMATAMPYIGRG
ncbi:MAG TPA: SDR family oxidoreductase [Acidimicrobiales bacterium]|nr:SDR family oxidoreductase [Acidimicrobiales bacterium]